MTRYQYRAIASNSSGTATSGPGVLYVNTGIPNTPIFDNPETDVCVGKTLAYHLTGGLEGYTIAWSEDNNSVHNDEVFNDSSNILNIFTNAATATIYVYAYNGCPGRSSNTLVVNAHPLQYTLPVTGGGTTCVSMEAGAYYGFTGQATAKGNLLQWATSQEQNTAYFDIQSSTAGSAFTSIARVAAAGNSHPPPAGRRTALDH